MLTKSTYFFFFTMLTCTFIVAQIFYLNQRANVSQDKEAFVRVVGLPDLALVSEAHYVRHRSLSGSFAFFADSPALLEYFPSTFVYTYAPSVRNHPSRIVREP